MYDKYVHMDVLVCGCTDVWMRVDTLYWLVVVDGYLHSWIHYWCILGRTFEDDGMRYRPVAGQGVVPALSIQHPSHVTENLLPSACFTAVEHSFTLETRPERAGDSVVAPVAE